MSENLFSGKICMFNKPIAFIWQEKRPYSLTDRVLGFEPSDGGSIPPRGTRFFIINLWVGRLAQPRLNRGQLVEHPDLSGRFRVPKISFKFGPIAQLVEQFPLKE